jgi:hypothetical protein
MLSLTLEPERGMIAPVGENDSMNQNLVLTGKQLMAMFGYRGIMPWLLSVGEGIA